MIFSVAIDGPAGAGKGTVAKHITKQFCLDHLDTGLLYRQAARIVLEQDVDVLDVVALEHIAHKVNPSAIDEAKLRNEKIASVASQIAIVPSLRRVLTQKMRDFATAISPSHKGVVLDGRDVGTVILPDADVKIYLTADEQVRAHRRTKELNAEQLDAILADIKARDERDSSRKADPLQVADDAVIIDTTFMDINTVCQKAEVIVANALAVYESGHPNIQRARG